jgi:enoyl-CoA hydratase/carnithine racemase
MSEEVVLYEAKDRIGRVTLNRPQAMNSLNIDVRKALVDVFHRIDEDPDVWVVIITGAGEKAFSAGADITEFTQEQTPIEVMKSRISYDFRHAMTHQDKPIIAAVNGYALGGGLELALACDIIIASEKASFGLPEVTVGVMPGGGGTQRLPRFVGRMKAMEMILTGERIDAQEAHRIGLVNRVVPPDQLTSTAEEMAGKIILRSPWAVRLARQSVLRGAEMHLDEAIRVDQYLTSLVFTTEDRLEGAQAFKEKRPPQFKGK